MRPIAANAALAALPHQHRSRSSRGIRTSSDPLRVRSRRNVRACVPLRRSARRRRRAAPAPTSSGQSTPVDFTIASIASRSIISIAAGTIPALTIPETHDAASVVVGKVAKKVRVVSGARRMRTQASVTIPISPSLPTSAAHQVVPERVGERRTEAHDLALAVTIVAAVT